MTILQLIKQELEEMRHTILQEFHHHNDTRNIDKKVITITLKTPTTIKIQESTITNSTRKPDNLYYTRSRHLTIDLNNPNSIQEIIKTIGPPNPQNIIIIKNN